VRADIAKATTTVKHSRPNKKGKLEFAFAAKERAKEPGVSWITIMERFGALSEPQLYELEFECSMNKLKKKSSTVPPGSRTPDLRDGHNRGPWSFGDRYPTTVTMMLALLNPFRQFDRGRPVADIKPSQSLIRAKCGPSSVTCICPEMEQRTCSS
jgi:hypothetical protein